MPVKCVCPPPAPSGGALLSWGSHGCCTVIDGVLEVGPSLPSARTPASFAVIVQPQIVNVVSCERATSGERHRRGLRVSRGEPSRAEPYAELSAGTVRVPDGPPQTSSHRFPHRVFDAAEGFPSAGVGRPTPPPLQPPPWLQASSSQRCTTVVDSHSSWALAGSRFFKMGLQLMTATGRLVVAC